MHEASTFYNINKSMYTILVIFRMHMFIGSLLYQMFLVISVKRLILGIIFWLQSEVGLLF